MEPLKYSIRIAIAGKRDHEKLVQLDTDGRLNKILHALSEIALATANIQTQFLTGLADGSDQQVTNAVFDHGNRTKLPICVDAVLPFHPLLYRDHPIHPIKAKERFNELLEKCHNTICVNDEETSERICDIKYADAGKAADRGYEAQALLMLRRCDILLAIADPNEQVKTGGTLQTVNKARAFHIPVIFISLKDEHIYLLDEHDNTYDTLPMLLQKKTPAEEDAIAALFKSIICLQTPVADDENDEGVDHEASLLLGLRTTQERSNTRLRRGIWKWTNARLRKQALNAIDQEDQAKGIVKAAPLKPIKNSSDTTYTIIDQHRNIDAVNGHFADQYRGGFILNNLLAIMAVAIAITSLYILLPSITNDGLIEHWLPVLTILKLCVLIVIDRNSKLGHHKNWNEKAIQTRYLAERMRVLEYLSLNGILKGIRPSLGKHISSTFQSAPPEAIYRKAEAGISFEKRPVRYLKPFKDLKQMNDELIQEQVGYHRTAWYKMKKLEHFLAHYGKRLNHITIFLVIVDLLILLFVAFIPHEHLHECYPAVVFAHEHLTPVFICLTALFPALVAAFNAVRFQTEAKKLKERSKTMYELLSLQHRKIEEQLEKIQGNSLGSDILESFPLITEVEQILLDEVSDWSLLYRKEFVET